MYFNCNDINNQTENTCELYRIIGAFPVDDGTGKIENRIKLIKAENYGDNYWNSNGTNNWSEPATLNTTFNTTYWNIINENYKSLVEDAKYYLGGYNNTLNIKTNVMWGYERKKEGSTYYYSGNPVNWTGKIALMYISDYGYASNSTCSDERTLYEYNDSICTNNNWLYDNAIEWLLSQTASIDTTVYRIYINGNVYSYYTSDYGNKYGVEDVLLKVRPVFYLTADAEFNDIGDGSQGNPYQLLR